MASQCNKDNGSSYVAMNFTPCHRSSRVFLEGLRDRILQTLGPRPTGGSGGETAQRGGQATGSGPSRQEVMQWVGAEVAMVAPGIMQTFAGGPGGGTTATSATAAAQDGTIGSHRHKTESR